MGIIRGSVEPGETQSKSKQIIFFIFVINLCLLRVLCVFMATDRYVIYGNHRDSWVHGAIDPSSGTSVMLELTRVLGRMVKQGKESNGSQTYSMLRGSEQRVHLCSSMCQVNGGLAGPLSLEAGEQRSLALLDLQNIQR